MFLLGHHSRGSDMSDSWLLHHDIFFLKGSYRNIKPE
jgi:hypothetical protein